MISQDGLVNGRVQTSRDEREESSAVQPKGGFKIVEEFLLEILGGLVPGVLFINFAPLALLTPLSALVSALAISLVFPDLYTQVLRFVEASKGTPSMIWIGALCLLFLLSYVLGSLFFRRDPKLPNRRSFRRIARECPRKIRDDPAKRREWLENNLACTSEDDCEFPYPYMRAYLEQRGHRHLSSLVTWWGTDGRSKTVINRYKIRLQYYFPAAHRRIVARNEAHVRLATSTWFVARTLMRFSLVGIALVTLALAIVLLRFRFDSPWQVAYWYVPQLLPPVFVLAAALYIRNEIEQFIHYQRLREVYYVLEQTYTAFRDEPRWLECPSLTIGTAPPSIESESARS